MQAPSAEVSTRRVDIDRALALLRTAGDALERRRRLVLALIVVAQWGGVLAIALAARHNAWLYYNGGDGVYYWTGAWALGHFTLPFAQIGFGLASLQAIGGAFLGPSMLSGLPFVILLNGLLLLPLVPLLLYGIAERIAGRLFGLFTAALWLAMPLLAYRMFRPDYRTSFLDIFLPGSFGLNALGDFPSLVVCLASAYFVLRAIDTVAVTDAVLAGTLAGFALAVKPSNALFVPAPMLGLLVARRFPQALAFLIALAPAVLALVIWKYRGLGALPLLSNSLGSLRLAAGSLPIAGIPDVSRYGGIHWSAIEENLTQLREIFWSKTLLEWVAIGGTFGLLRRSFAKGIVIVAWFGAYFLVKGGSSHASVYAGSFFRLLTPAYPAYVLLAAASAILLLPRHRPRPRPQPRPVGRRAVVAAVCVLGLVPLVLVGTARPASRGEFAQPAGASVDIKIVELGLTASSGGGSVRLSWRPQHSSSVVAYRIFRAATAQEDCNTLANGVGDCVIKSKAIANTAGTSYVDRPGSGHWIYRVALTAAWNLDPSSGDPLLLSGPVAVTVR